MILPSPCGVFIFIYRDILIASGNGDQFSSPFGVFSFIWLLSIATQERVNSFRPLSGSFFLYRET